ncbi:MAG: hypothetical protein R3F11_15050 [Verrucomicrobiales bacterium]
MFSHTWDVREFRGRRAQIQVVDAVSGGWGNIGIDHVVFSDQPGDGMPVEPAAELPRGAEAAAERLAQQRGLQGAAVLPSPASWRRRKATNPTRSTDGDHGGGRCECRCFQ